MTQPPRIDAGTSRLFTVQYSAAPTGVPNFAVRIDSAEVVVYSVAATSDTTANKFQATYTMPTNSNGVYAYEWTATFSAAPTALPDRTRGLFQVFLRTPWTT